MNDHSLQKHPEELCNSQFEHSVTTQISRCELLHTPNSRSQGGHPEGCNRTIWQIISCNSMFGCQKYMILSQAMNLQLSFNFCILKNVCKNWKSRIWKYPRHVGDEARASATPKKIIKKLKLKIKKNKEKIFYYFTFMILYALNERFTAMWWEKRACNALYGKTENIGSSKVVKEMQWLSSFQQVRCLNLQKSGLPFICLCHLLCLMVQTTFSSEKSLEE